MQKLHVVRKIVVFQSQCELHTLHSIQSQIMPKDDGRNEPASVAQVTETQCAPI